MGHGCRKASILFVYRSIIVGWSGLVWAVQSCIPGASCAFVRQNAPSLVLLGLKENAVVRWTTAYS